METIKKFNSYIDSISMYRIMYCTLAILAALSVALSIFGKLPYGITPISLGILFASLSFVAIGTHSFFAKLFSAPANIESTYITLFILFFIAKPPETLIEVGWTALLAFTAIAGKYVLSWNNRAVFNPAALALVVIGILGAQLHANSVVSLWWVGAPVMFVPILVTAFIVVKKLRRFEMVLTYLGVSVAFSLFFAMYHHDSLIAALKSFLFSTPALYFAGFMLTEPLTTPMTRMLRVVYAVIVAVLGSLTVHVGGYGMTPELALCMGNLFAFVTGMRSRITLTLKERVLIASNTEEFVFAPSRHVPFRAGQYVEWTLPHADMDIRGVRRYFTIASAPSDSLIKLGTKFLPEHMQGSHGSSTFKNGLKDLKVGEKLWVTALSGDFTLPRENGPLVFIAGGIGITPFASMIREMLAEGDKEKRDVVVFYANRTEGDIAYRGLLDEASKKLGIRIIHILSSPEAASAAVWTGETGFLTEALLKRYLSSLLAPVFYISGPSAMVDSYKSMLRAAGVPSHHIKTDYFPGLA